MRNIIPDYKVDDADTNDVHKIMLTDQEINEKHPTEYVTHHSRSRQNYLSQIEKNEFLLFNLPQSVTTSQQLREIVSAKGVNVYKAKLTKALDSTTNAFAYIQVANPSQVKLVKEKLRNFWIEDRKIKLKTRDDLTYETFDNRTVIVQNLPIHLRSNKLVEVFSAYGSLTSIELPTKNVAIENEIKHKMDKFVKERRENEHIQLKRAQKVVHDSVKENEDHFRSVLKGHFSQEQQDEMILDMAGANDQKPKKID